MSLDPIDIREWVQSQLPKNDALGFSNYLLDCLKELMSAHSDSLASVKDQLEVVYVELQSFQPFVKGVAEQGNNARDEIIHNFAERVIDTGYEVEYIIDSFVVGDVPHTYLTEWLSEIIREIKLIKTELYIYRENPTARNKELVVFEDVRNTIINRLFRGSRELDVVSIVGAAGSGKTTFARSFQEDRGILSHFDFWAEFRVSQEYTRKDLLLSILGYANYEPTELSKKADHELADRLRKFLLTKRYLLIIDDVWEVKAWTDLKLYFPDARNCSRIILTTRFRDVALYASQNVTKPHHLRSLTLPESWILLQKKVFGKEICPKELSEVGKRIAKLCKGVPLSIVLVAGLLAKTDSPRICWKQMESLFGERIQPDTEALAKLSYNDLPDILKPLLLYFGASFEDKEISVSKLTSLWIAEGFIESDKEMCLEDIAEHYLEDMIGRNLITVTKRSSRKIKACRLQNLVLKFCKAKAEEDNFLLCLKRDYDANPPHLFSEKPSHRRLSFCSNQDDLAGWRPSCSHARSVLVREVSDNTCSSMGHASIIFGSFKFLRVLDLEFVVVESFPTELNHLRYLAVQTTADSIPSSIENLPNLQTFIVKRTGGQEVQLPDTFWKLIKLRHVSISDRASFNFHNAQESLDVIPSKLDDLTTLSSLYVSSAEDMERIVSKVPNLRTLKCEFADSWGWEKNENGFSVLDSLRRLETLKVHFFNFPKVGPSRLNFPLNLKKLTLCKFYLPPAEISIIAKLVNLEILKLQQVVFEREEWEVADKEFPKLELLKLENLKLSQWRASDEAFQNLRGLVVTKCLKLEAIPLCFAYLCSLEWIEVKSCNQFVADSAMDIRNTQVEDYGNDDFKVSIEL